MFNWPIVKYVPASSLGNFAGRTVLFYIRIDERYREDKGLLMHETTHYHQFLASPIMFPLRYWLSNVWRYKYELEAYKVQLQHSTNRAVDAELFARFILYRYNLGGLDLTIESIKKDLLS